MNSNVTPLRRLTVALSIGKSFSMMVVLIPISLLLTFKAIEINPNRATNIFSLVTGVGAIFALLGNPIGGAISDRTSLSFGRRRTWIMLGSILGSAALMGLVMAKTEMGLLIFWCLTQLFYNFAFASYMALIPDQVPEPRRGSISGILGLAMPVSIVIGYLLMNAMSRTPLVLRFGTLAIIGIAVAIVTCILKKTRPQPADKAITINALH